MAARDLAAYGILGRLDAALNVIKAAMDARLPAPWDVDVSGSTIRLAVDNLADLTEWAKHMDATITDSPGAGANVTHYEAEGAVADVAVRCWLVDLGGAS